MEKVIINGFFSKGNCGDEAILQTWYEMFHDKYKIIASVDGQVLNNSDKYKEDLYSSVSLINNNSVSFSTERDVKALIIGGGGLGLGFGVRQLLHSKLRKKKNFYLGVTVHDEFFDGDEYFIDLNRNIFRCFDLITVRDKYSEENLKKIFNIDCLYFPDIAFGLLSEPIEIKTNRKFISVTIRDYGKNDEMVILNWIDKIKSFAMKNDLEILYLPFDKGDETLLNRLGISNLYKEIYWSPKKMKYIISKSEFCFSIGRYHPLVFAISESVTPYYIDIKSDRNSDNKFEYKNRDKCFYIMSDNKISQNYLINSDIDVVEFEKCSNIKSISSEIKEEVEIFKKIIYNELNKI
jgi:polysaccharide pyruvyl transferase WcaK-like protein